ncbi:MAG: DUF4410 domain-containing protein [Candidatus Acidiferrum sp.]
MLQRSPRLFAFSLLVVAAAVPLTGRLWPVQAKSQSVQDHSPSSVPIYINDFELFASATNPPSAKNSDSSKKTDEPGTPALVFDTADVPGIQARRLMDYFADTLVDDFKKRGYNASRRQLHPQADKGALISGVFAEPDAKNRIRRAMLGGGAPGATMILYAATFNLGRPSEPLYLPAAEQNSDARYGPIISLNNYIPMARFELSKYPTQKEVQEISIQIVQNVSKLLEANPAAFAQ